MSSSNRQHLLKARELSEKKAEELRLKEIVELKARIAAQEKQGAPAPKTKKRARILTEPVTPPPVEEKNKQENTEFELIPVKEKPIELPTPAYEEPEFEEDFMSEEEEPEPPKKRPRDETRDTRPLAQTKAMAQRPAPIPKTPPSTLAKRPRTTPPEDTPQSLVESVTEKDPGILSNVITTAKPHVFKLGASLASQCVLLFGTAILVFGKNYLSKMGSSSQFPNNYPPPSMAQNYPSTQSAPPPAPNYPVSHNSNHPGVEKSLFGAPWK